MKTFGAEKFELIPKTLESILSFLNDIRHIYHVAHLHPNKTIQMFKQLNIEIFSGKFCRF